MTTSTKEKPKTIATRDDIATEHTWDLTDLYKSNEGWEADYSKAQQIISKANSFVGRLSESSSLLYRCLKKRSDLSLICSRLYQYAQLNLDLDNRIPEFQAMVDRAAMLSSQAGAAFAFVEPELLLIEESKLRAMASEFEKKDEYDFYIAELIRSRSHIRSEEVEELLAESSMIARGPQSIFTMLDDADIEYPSVTDADGNEIKLTKQRFAKILESNDQKFRRDAHNAFYTPYKAHTNSLGVMLSTSVNKDIFYSRARRYESCLHAALDGDNIPLAVYRSLIDSTRANLKGLHNYTELRKKVLGLDKIWPYDMVCPLFPDMHYEVLYDEAINEVLEAVKPLGEDYIKVLKKGFESRWVDVYETEGKGSGAYSWGSYSAHPYVLMNYSDTVNNMFTLAHEMGHAMHSYLSNSTQPYPKAHYSTFVAEVASTLNEGLLLDHLLKKTDDKRARLYLLNRHIDNTVGTFFNQVMYADFELAVHEHVEGGQALSHELMNGMWEELTQTYYGPVLSMDEYTPLKWSRIPHFYMTFYVYQYATSYAASQAILDKFMAGEEGIVEKYLELLSSGGKDHPIELLRSCGVNMAESAPFEATIGLFAKQVDEVERLAGG